MMMFFGLYSLVLWLTVNIQAIATPVRHLAFHHRHQRHGEAQHLSTSDSEPQISIQRPLLAAQATPSSLEVNHTDVFVGLTFETGDSEHGVQLREVTFPMRKRIRPGMWLSESSQRSKLTQAEQFPDLPRHPRIARLDYAYYSGPPGMAVKPYESIDAVVCYLYPAMDEEEGPFAPAYEFMAFRRQDEVVGFHDPRGKVFLAGRAVDSFECV